MPHRTVSWALAMLLIRALPALAQTGVGAVIGERSVGSPKVYVCHDFGAIAVSLGLARNGYTWVSESEFPNYVDDGSGGGTFVGIERRRTELSLVMYTPSVDVRVRLHDAADTDWFARLGVGKGIDMTSEYKEDVPLSQQDDYHLMMGVGIEQGLTEHLRLSGETGIMHISRRHESSSNMVVDFETMETVPISFSRSETVNYSYAALRLTFYP